LGEKVLVAEDGKTLAEALIDFFQANNKLTNLMEWAITKEVNATSKPKKTLFGDYKIVLDIYKTVRL
jgi:hypothetical protein